MRLKIRVAHLAQIGVLLVILTAAATAVATKALLDVRKVDQKAQVLLEGRKHEVDATTQRLKLWYMEKNERLWSELAEYQAAATIKAAREQHLDLSLLVGTITAESEGYPFARSRTGAKGSGQVDFKAHADRFPLITKESEKYDPEVNIRCSAVLLKEYTMKYGVRNGLQVYNLGTGSFERGRRNPKYSRKVLKLAREYRHF